MLIEPQHGEDSEANKKYCVTMNTRGIFLHGTRCSNVEPQHREDSTGFGGISRGRLQL